MYCKHCGKQIDDDSRFCPHCGGTQAQTIISQVQSPVSQSQIISSTLTISNTQILSRKWNALMIGIYSIWGFTLLLMALPWISVYTLDVSFFGFVNYIEEINDYLDFVSYVDNDAVDAVYALLHIFLIISTILTIAAIILLFLTISRHARNETSCVTFSIILSSIFIAIPLVLILPINTIMLLDESFRHIEHFITSVPYIIVLANIVSIILARNARSAADDLTYYLKEQYQTRENALNTVSSYICSKCGTYNKKGARSCINCGNKLG